MEDRTSAVTPDRGILWRGLAFFDPGRPGFLRRMTRLGTLGLIAAGMLLFLGLFVAGGTPDGRYLRGVLWLVIDQPARAEKLSAALVAAHPDRNAVYYHLWATSLRRQDRIEEQLDVYGQAAEQLPRSWFARQRHCLYGALFASLEAVPAPVRSSCEAADELARGPEEALDAGVARAMAAGVDGDVALAREELRQTLEIARAAGLDPRSAWDAYLTRLERGDNPFQDEETMRHERRRF